MEQQPQRHPTLEEETIESIAARRITKEYLEKTAKELPQLLIDETTRKKEKAAMEREETSCDLQDNVAHPHIK